MTEPASLDAQNVGHRLESGRWLFCDLSFSVRPGEITALLGGNGCGKTTLLRATARLGRLTQGNIRQIGTMAFVPQNAAATFPYPTLEIVVMGRASRIGLFGAPSAADYQRAEAALDRLGINHLAAQPFDTLSGGERQLVMIARALTSEAQIVVLDEPAAALDFRHQDRVLTVLRSLADQDGMALLFSTHAPQHVLAIADHAVLIRDADRHWVGRAADVMIEPTLGELYGLPMRIVDVPAQTGQVKAVAPIFISQLTRTSQRAS